MSNRPIKFRVWDKQKKEWFPIKNAMCLVLNPESTDLCFMTKQGPYPLPQTNQEDGGLNRFEIQQFTGLTDSTGKEIYEGDIVCEKMTDDIAFEGGECNLGQVFFAAGTFMIDGDGPLYDHTHSLTPDRLEDYLVVGNVFETPELLA